MSNYYIINLETGKLELHFDKEDYSALSEEQKRNVKSNFLWGRKSNCWISRCKEPNLYHAKRIAEALGLEDAGKTGERISFAEQQQRKADRAERRAEHYDHIADNAEKRAETLVKPFEDHHGDIAFFTQPNINTSAGRAFTRQREKVFDKFDRGMDELNKADHYRNRAETARNTADQINNHDKGFIMRRIKECESAIRKLEKYTHRTDDIQDRLDAQLDKLRYYMDALEAIGGVEYSKDNIKPGYIVDITKYGKCTVISTGPKYFKYITRVGGCVLTASYAEINGIVSAIEKQASIHPYKVGDTFECSDWNFEKHKSEKHEYKIIRTTDKSVTLQRGSEKPFIRKPSEIKRNGVSEWRLCITDWNDGIVYRSADI